MRLRDHDQRCGHESAYRNDSRGWSCRSFDCPGGREINIDWWGADEQAHTEYGNGYRGSVPRDDRIARIVNRALGLEVSS